MSQISGTLIRVKRPREKDPSDSLLVGKRCRLDGTVTDEPIIFKRISQVEIEENEAIDISASRVLDAKKSDLEKSLYKQPCLKPIKEVLRDSTQSSSKSKRFQLTMLKRGLSTSSFNGSDVTLVDANIPISEENKRLDVPNDETICCNSTPMESVKTEFTYDFYFSKVPYGELDSTALAYEEEMYESSEDEEWEEESDENDEDYWKHDYPDEYELASQLQKQHLWDYEGEEFHDYKSDDSEESY